MRSTPANVVTAGERLARSAGIVGLATMSSRLLGVVREQLLAYLFGAGREMDAFNVAFRVPNLLRDLFAEGAMSAAFVPVFTSYLSGRTRREAWRMGSGALNLLAVTTIVAAGIGIVFARPLVTLLASGFAAVPGKLELTVTLTRVMLPFLTLVAVAAVLMGMLNSLHRFFVPSFAPAMFNVGTIVCTLALVPLMPALGWPRIMGAAIGTLVGGVLQAGIQWPALRREGFQYSATLDPSDDGVRRVLRVMGPGLVGMAAVQVNLFTNTLLATSQGDGAVSWLNYAFRLVYLPLGLFGVSIATASLPTIAQSAATNDLLEVRRTLSRALRMMLVLNVPATIGLIILARPIVALLFQRGEFTSYDASATAAALVCYAPGLVGYCTIKVAVPSLYALDDTRTPMLASITAVAGNLALNLALMSTLGYRGLALGTSLTALANGGLLLSSLRRRLGGLDGRRIAVTVMKIVISSGLMAFSVTLALRLVGGETEAASGLQVAAAILFGLATLLATARALGLSELDEAVAIFVRTLRPAAGRTEL